MPFPGVQSVPVTCFFNGNTTGTSTPPSYTTQKIPGPSWPHQPRVIQAPSFPALLEDSGGHKHKSAQVAGYGGGKSLAPSKRRPVTPLRARTRKMRQGEASPIVGREAPNRVPCAYWRPTSPPGFGYRCADVCTRCSPRPGRFVFPSYPPGWALQKLQDLDFAVFAVRPQGYSLKKFPLMPLTQFTKLSDHSAVT